MSALNLNTVSYEDLTALDGIGQHRATASLKLREDMGFLTEDRHKTISSRHLWYHQNYRE